MARTARDVVRDALGLIGVYSRGMNLAAEDSTLGFNALKDMVASWSAEGSNIPVYTKDSITLTAGTQEFSVGPSQDIDVTLPVLVAVIILTASQRRLSPISFAEWAAVKDSEQGEPARFYYGYGVTGELKLDRAPSSSLAAEMWSKKTRANISSVNSDLLLSFDEADIPALKYNLAIDLAPSFDQNVTQEVLVRAREYKNNVDIRYSQPMYASTDLSGVYEDVEYVLWP